jgi:hypothetical protein
MTRRAELEPVSRDEMTSVGTPWPPALDQRLEPVIRVLMTACAFAVIASWALLAAAHIQDRYLVAAGLPGQALQGGNASVWMAQARAANLGQSYPELYDGHAFGGTRYAPLPIWMWAVTERVTGDYVVAGKVAAYMVGIALLGLAFVIMRRLSGSIPMALLLASTILVSVPGLVATMGTLRGDALPLLLQLAAVAVIARSTDARACALAGALCALALTSKLSAGWAPIAITIWLAIHARRRVPVFLGVLAVSVVVLFSVFQAMSDGRMLENFQATLFADTGGTGSLLAPLRLFQLMADAAEATAVLFPVALVGLVIAAARRDATLYDLSVVCGLLVLTLVLADGGAQTNHLIDAIVLIPIAVAGFVGRLARLPGASAARLAIAVVALWAVGLSYGLYVQHDVRDAAASVVRRAAISAYDPQPLRGHLRPGDTVLSEDPYVPLSIGQQPVVLDPWMLVILGEQHPDWPDSLAMRIARREFKAVILSQRLETSDPVYRHSVFGEQVLRAVCQHYRFADFVEGYWVYAPAAPGVGEPSLATADTQGPNACATR